jgi:hypothetical protein
MVLVVVLVLLCELVPYLLLVFDVNVFVYFERFQLLRFDHNLFHELVISIFFLLKFVDEACQYLNVCLTCVYFVLDAVHLVKELV